MTEMHDNYHKIELAFTTDNSYRVLEIATSMEKVPFESCRNALPSLERLASTGVFEGGVLRKINYITKIIPSLAGTCISFDRS